MWLWGDRGKKEKNRVKCYIFAFHFTRRTDRSNRTSHFISFSARKSASFKVRPSSSKAIWIIVLTKSEGLSGCGVEINSAGEAPKDLAKRSNVSRVRSPFDARVLLKCWVDQPITPASWLWLLGRNPLSLFRESLSLIFFLAKSAKLIRKPAIKGNQLTYLLQLLTSKLIIELWMERI